MTVQASGRGRRVCAQRIAVEQRAGLHSEVAASDQRTTGVVQRVSDDGVDRPGRLHGAAVVTDVAGGEHQVPVGLHGALIVVEETIDGERERRGVGRLYGAPGVDQVNGVQGSSPRTGKRTAHAVEGTVT